MSVRKVAVLGHPVLRKPAEPIPVKDIKSPKIQQLIQDMAETMVEYDGRGLAAPQVHESLQLVIMLWDFTPDEEPSLLCLINPKIKPVTKETSSYWEGCLSVPGLRGKVTRPNIINVEAYNEKGEELSFRAEGFSATVIQHECDHLIGALYLDRMDDMSQLAFNREYQRYLAGDDDSAEGEGGEG
jgi:peptide deformylase